MAYELQEARRLVLEAGRRMQRDGLIARTWGNISARISETEMVITPSGRSYDSLVPEDIVRVNISDGTWAEETAAGRKPVKPSSEKLVHMAIYQERPGVNFIIHTHQAYASALGVLGRELGDPVMPCAGYGMNATRLLQENVAAAAKRHPEAPWVLMKNHGAVVFDSSYEEHWKWRRGMNTGGLPGMFRICPLASLRQKRMEFFDIRRSFPVRMFCPACVCGK